jgi:hypothetical protein
MAIDLSQLKPNGTLTLDVLHLIPFPSGNLPTADYGTNYGEIRFTPDGAAPVAVSLGYQWIYLVTSDNLNSVQTYFTGYANDRSVDSSYRIVDDATQPTQGYYPITPIEMINSLAYQVKRLLGADQWYSIDPIQNAVKPSAVSGNITAIPNSSYRITSTGLVTITLPTTAKPDTVIKIIGIGSGGWKITQNANQRIYFGNKVTLAGTAGSINSTNQRDCVELICITENLEWQVYSSIGNINVVEI